MKCCELNELLICMPSAHFSYISSAMLLGPSTSIHFRFFSATLNIFVGYSRSILMQKSVLSYYLSKLLPCHILILYHASTGLQYNNNIPFHVHMQHRVL